MPLSIPSSTRCGDRGSSAGCARRTGDTGTCTLDCDFDLRNRSSRNSDILDCARFAATEFDLARGAEPARLTSVSVSELCFAFFCSALSFNRACISWSFNCRVYSSSSSANSSNSISSFGSVWALFRTAEADVNRLVGDGEGEARSARRRSRSRPRGVLKRTSWGDFGGQLSFALASWWLAGYMQWIENTENTHVVT